MRNIYILLNILYFSLFQKEMLIIFYRHGSRLATSIDGSPTNLSSRQHYILGKRINYLYNVENYNKIVNYRSSKIRTLNSFIANSYGIFNNYTSDKYKISTNIPKKLLLPNFKSAKDYQINSNYIFYNNNYYPQSPYIKNNIFNYFSENCPNFKKKNKSRLYKYLNYFDKKNPNYFNSLKQTVFNSKIYKYLLKTKNIKISKLSELHKYSDLLITFSYEQKNEFFNKNLIDQLYHFKLICYYKIFEYEKNILSVKKLGEELKKNINEFIKSKESTLNIFSGHDTTMLRFIKSFFPDNKKCIKEYYEKLYINNELDKKSEYFDNCIYFPRYSSVFIFEIKSINNKFIIIFKYDNKVKFIDLSEFLDLNKFISLLDNNLINPKDGYDC